MDFPRRKRASALNEDQVWLLIARGKDFVGIKPRIIELIAPPSRFQYSLFYFILATQTTSLERSAPSNLKARPCDQGQESKVRSRYSDSLSYRALVKTMVFLALVGRVVNFSAIGLFFLKWHLGQDGPKRIV